MEQAFLDEFAAASFLSQAKASRDSAKSLGQETLRQAMLAADAPRPLRKARLRPINRRCDYGGG
jgi:hypothetical protein